jgi:hypothetical protein
MNVMWWLVIVFSAFLWVDCIAFWRRNKGCTVPYWAYLPGGGIVLWWRTR